MLKDWNLRRLRGFKIGLLKGSEASRLGGEKVERIQDLEVRRLRSSKIGKLKGQEAPRWGG